MIRAVYLLWAIVVFTISAWLFKKAAGTLSIKKLNIISFAFYSLLFFSFIGAVLILMGFKDHYMVGKINDEDVVMQTFAYLSYGMIMLPAAILAFSKLFLRGKIEDQYNNYLQAKLHFEKNENAAIVIASIATLIGIAATVYMFYNIGSIPLFTTLFSNSEVDDTLRIQVTREYSGNVYIRNIVVLTIIPVISYFCYIYARVSKTKRTCWVFLFLINAAVAVLIKTYNLEKAPVVYWLFNFYIIEILLGNKKLKVLLIGIACLSVLFIMGAYLYSGYENSFLSLSSGPLSRIIITQSSTLFLHVKAFPAEHEFLAGKSLPTVVAWLAGTTESWVRSGRIVMEIYNPQGVAAGEAGVMNAMFLGEAYANWGITGVLIAPLVVAIPFVFIFVFLLRSRKTPLMIVLYVALLSTFITCLQGGFVDFIYNTNAILFIGLVFGIVFVFNRGVITLRRRRD